MFVLFLDLIHFYVDWHGSADSHTFNFWKTASQCRLLMRVCFHLGVHHRVLQPQWLSAVDVGVYLASLSGVKLPSSARIQSANAKLVFFLAKSMKRFCRPLMHRVGAVTAVNQFLRGAFVSVYALNVE